MIYYLYKEEQNVMIFTIYMSHRYILRLSFAVLICSNQILTPVINLNQVEFGWNSIDLA